MRKKLSAFSFQLSADSKGFTLLEMLVVLALFGIVGTMATVSLFLLFRGAAKTDYIKEIKQNGDYALSVMEVKIRNNTIRDANCTGNPGTTLIISSADLAATETTYSCVHDATSNTNRITEQTGEATNFLTNTSVTVPAVPADCDLSNVSFVCTIGPGGNKVVDIYLTLQQANTGASSVEATSQVFQTQINLRNR